MARTIAVILDAQTGSYVRSLGAAEAANQKFRKSTREMGRQTEASFNSQEQVSARASQRRIADLKAQEAATIKYQREVDKYGKSTAWINQNADDLNRLSSGMLAVGAATVAGLGLAAKAAIDWESAWTGVEKTVDGSAKQLNALEGSLRLMAKTMPATHSEIAAVAEAAGQLGVATPAVDEFTKVMIDLGETTNLTSEEAATSLAQLMNVMGTAAGDVDNLGATIVALGNDGASTEKDIVEMAQRIAGAGRQVGLSEQEVLAFASSLASVGINAEAGGTAISMSMLKIDGAVRDAGDGLDLLAETSGMSSEKFAKAWEKDAAGAMDTFLIGLGKVQASGGDVTAVLEQLGITGIRESDALRRLANASGLLTENLDLSGEAWERNSALALEAAERYSTTESQARIAWNNIKDAGIDAGQSLLPVVAQLAGGAVSIAEAFQKIPPELVGFVTKAAGVTAAAALLGGGLIRAATSGAEVLTMFRNLQASSPRAASAVGKVGKAAGIAAAAFIALQAAGALADHFGEDFSVSVSEAARVLSNLASEAPKATQGLNEFFEGPGRIFTDGISGFDEAIAALDAWDFKLDDFINGLTGKTSNLDVINQKFDQMDNALVAMTQSGSLDLAQEGFDKLARKWQAAGKPMNELLDLFPDYKAELESTAEELGVHNLKAEQYVQWMRGKIPQAIKEAQAANEKYTPSIKTVRRNLDGVGSSAEDAQQDLDKLVDSMFDMQQQALKSSSAAIGFEQALDDAHKEAKQGKRTLNIHTQAGRDNRRALDEIASSAHALIEEQVQQGKSTKDVTQTTERARRKFIDTTIEMGATRKEARRLADQYGLIPDDVKTKIDAPGMGQTQKEIDRLKNKYDAIKSRTVEMDFKILSNGTVINGDGTFRQGKKGPSSTYATGGPVHGPGGPTSDSIPAWLSNGEFVINAQQTAKHRQLLEAINRDRVQGFRDGGIVQSETLSISPLIDSEAVSQARSLMSDSQRSIMQGAVDTLRSMFASGGVRLGSDQLVNWNGGTFTENFANHLKLVHDQLPFQVYQGGWNPGGVAASGSTHDKDAIDAGPNYDRLAGLLRGVGIAAWHRYPSQGPWRDHVHGVPGPQSGIASPAAASQYRDLMNGGNGLGGVDDGPHVALGSALLSVGSTWSGGDVGGFSRGQLNNAATIISVARSLGLGNRAAQIALMTAMQESTLRNLPGGDRDSVGLFQQRGPWGSFGRRTNPAQSARMFFLGGQGGQRGLTDFNWRGMGLSQAAQAVQVSAYPSAYAKWSDEARAILSRFADGGYVSGPGTSTSDSINARLSNGEYVVNAAATKQNRAMLDMINYNTPARFATGGPVGPGGGTTTIGTPVVHVTIQDPFSGQMRTVMAEVTHTEMRKTAVAARTTRRV